jgi:hypothetical protein
MALGKEIKKMMKILCRVPDRGQSAKYIIDATSTPSISTCVITISHMVCLDFKQRMSQLPRNILIFFIIASTGDIMTSWQFL